MLESPKDIIPKIVIKLFPQFHNIQTKWAQRLITLGVDKDDLVKADMIFLVKLLKI